MPDLTDRLCAVALLGSLAVAACDAAPASEATHDMQTLTSARQYSGEDELDVQIDYAAGELAVAPGDSSMLYRMEVRFDAEHFTPLTEYDRSDGTLHLGVEPLEDDDVIHGLPDEARASIQLNPVTPMELSLEFGAGTADLDLGGLALRSVDISTGASETEIRFDEPNRIAADLISIGAGAAELRVTGLGNARAERIEFSGGVGRTVLDFSGDWRRDASVSAELGIGALTLRLPRDVGVRIDRESLLTTFDSEDLTRRGGEYFSGNWDSAPYHLNMNLEAALGSIDIEWIDDSR